MWAAWERGKRETLALPLSFLGSGQYTAKIWRDAPNSEAEPNHLLTETFTVSSGDLLKVRMALDGGFVAQFLPAGK